MRTPLPARRHPLTLTPTLTLPRTLTLTLTLTPTLTLTLTHTLTLTLTHTPTLTPPLPRCASFPPDATGAALNYKIIVRDARVLAVLYQEDEQVHTSPSPSSRTLTL